MKLMYLNAGVKDEATDKTVKACAALTLVSACCHGVLNTTLIKPESAKEEQKFEWFDDVKLKLDAAKVVARDWIDNVAVPIQSDIPISVITFDNQFQASADYVIDVCKKHPRMKKGDAEFEDVNEVLRALMQTIEDDIIASIDESRTALKNWGNSLQEAHDNLSGEVQTIQKAESDISTEIERLNTSIDALNNLISSESTLVSVGAGLVGGGIFVAVVGVALLAAGVGAVVGGIVIGVGAAMTIGGAVTWGVMQHRIDEQYEEIAQDRKEILQDQQLLASLKGLEVGTSSAVSYMQTALSALDEVKTTWEGFYGVIENAVKELDKAEKSATAVLKQIFTETAKKQWADAHEMAEKLLDTKIQIEDKGVIGDKAA